MSKKSANFYVKDSLVLRIIMIASIVSIELIQFLWEFLISPKPYIHYFETFTNYTIVGIFYILNMILTLSVVVIFFFSISSFKSK